MSNLLSIQVEGLPALEEKMQRLVSAMDTRTILDQSAALLLHNIMQRFLQQVSPDGEPWAPLKPATQKQHDARGGGGILFASGKLFRSLQVFQVDATSRGLGTDVPYGKFPQFGTINMPARVFLGFSENDAQVVEQLLLRTAQEALNA